MKIFSGIKAVVGKFPNPVIAIGVFDGLHYGHQALIRKAVERAKRIRGTAIVMTFDPHPVRVLRPENRLPLLVSLPFRLKLIAAMGVDVTVVVRFTRAFSRLAPKQFIAKYLLRPFSPREIIVGDDFRFGQDRAGTIAFFEQAGKRNDFKVLSLKTKERGRKKFSSTMARDFVVNGQLRKAADILGRPVSLWGRVVFGDKRGKTLGYPTANIVPTGEVLPPRGVYVVRVRYKNKILEGMCNVGVRPSFHNKDCLNVEVHIFNFNQNLYGEDIVVEFLQKIRNELYFPSREALVTQLKKDESFSRKWFIKNKK
ncbi:MAG: bifunctional riboflavin kinase/FAD synthetase [Candidatus Omnitrophica bacterium]|nr:bifunctional riboflavin kinase/FAD synthetase [Candidatus Omnitrophota bacterium]